MNYTFTKDENGNVKVVEGHNNKAPGLLRIFAIDNRANKTKKMAEVKKDPKFQAMVLEYMGKNASDVIFRFNGNLGRGISGILIQDATQKFQAASIPEIEVTIDEDTPAEVPAEAAAEMVAEPEVAVTPENDIEVVTIEPVIVPEAPVEPAPMIENPEIA